MAKTYRDEEQTTVNRVERILGLLEQAEAVYEGMTDEDLTVLKNAPGNTGVLPAYLKAARLAAYDTLRHLNKGVTKTSVLAPSFKK